MLGEYLDEMGWSRDAAIPFQGTLTRLGLQDIAHNLWD
jgi:hypothetical protein